MRNRKGFALITVLWVVLGIAVLALAASMTGRDSLASARNRKALAQAQWKAEGCIERARAAIHQAMTSVQPFDVIVTWDSLDRVIENSPLLYGTSCTVTARAAGAALAINLADSEQLLRFFDALGMSRDRGDSLTAALLDWRMHKGLFRNVRELLQVRGFENFADTLNMFTTDENRMPLSHTPLPVLASLPGMDVQILSRISDMRRQDTRLSELLLVSTGLAQESQSEFMRNFAELSRKTTSDPDAWIITARAVAGDPEVATEIELRLARAGTRVAVIRRR